MVSVASNLVTFVLALSTVVWLDWRLALLALVLMPAYVIPTRRVGRRRKALKRARRRLMAELTGVLAETLSISGAQLIKVFGTEAVETEPGAGPGSSSCWRSTSAGADRPLVHDALDVVGSLGPALVFAGGGLLVMSGRGRAGHRGRVRRTHGQAVRTCGVAGGGARRRRHLLRLLRAGLRGARPRARDPGHARRRATDLLPGRDQLRGRVVRLSRDSGDAPRDHDRRPPRRDARPGGTVRFGEVDDGRAGPAVARRDGRTGARRRARRPHPHPRLAA